MDYKELSINERVNYLRKHEFDMTMEDFGQHIQMTKGAISYMEKGNRVVSERTIKIICAEFNVNEHWLRTGEGEIFIQPATFSFDEQIKKSNLSELEIAIMRGYMELDSEVRKAIVQKIESIIQQRSEIASTTDEDEIDAELERYRQELEAEKKVQTLSALQRRETS
ncbi:XRE family transcriptional regulator [Lysinibacillus mangiferihumi]|uniref:XRE family transcriptional regulator n=1 Tax=Lysinibacillus mangiferihumi TaxID=1130819 RepID=A0A4U2Z6Z0_9BACI|nr:helix-turn-helix transcriptional regulator [Lysinibacillus mangiferihumi]TKI70146.1 XRE family transcriptional regulator [Lysinibacillus mangiferihumi]